MHVDTLLPILTAVSLALLTMAFILRRLRVPYMIGYLLAGIALGPDGLRVVTDAEVLGHLGGVGVVLLLFYVGMEVSPRRLLAEWRIAIGGTLLQVLISVGCVAALGAFLEWRVERIVLLGFVISLSSTAMVLRLLRSPTIGESLSNQVTAILVAQDVVIIPMLLILGFFGGTRSILASLPCSCSAGAPASSVSADLFRATPSCRSLRR